MGCTTSIETKSDFSDKNFDNVDDFSLNDKILLARVVDIYDGDTCICVLNIFDNYYKFKIRLAEIDTEEMKNKNTAKKELAYLARNLLYILITGDQTIDIYETRSNIREKLQKTCYMVKLYCSNFDKYGRLLAYIFKKDFIFNNIDNNQNLIESNKRFSYNYYLVDNNLAVYYNGGTKGF